MTNKNFKTIKTDIFSFEKIVNPVSNNLVGVIINGIKYSKLKTGGSLTSSQLMEFEFLDDFVVENPINL